MPQAYNSTYVFFHNEKPRRTQHKQHAHGIQESPSQTANRVTTLVWTPQTSVMCAEPNLRPTFKRRTVICHCHTHTNCMKELNGR